MGWFGKSEGEIARDDHNRGEQDASKGEYNPPGDFVSDFLGCFIPGIDAVRIQYGADQGCCKG